MRIDVYYKNVYGNDLCYPSCEDAKIFAGLSRQKTLNTYTIAMIERLGYEVNVVAYNPIALDRF